jgi:DNA-directed RNA polymerase specialized sigma24 family protein
LDDPAGRVARPGGQIAHPVGQLADSARQLAHPAGQLADPAELIALIARARREAMLRAYRHMLRREDLEDCLSQAVFELLVRVRRGQRFASREHVANALEQRFLSRVYDRRRALHGRSPLQAALENALPLDGTGEQGIELADPRAEIHPLVTHRFQLRQVARLAPLLTPDQRLVLVCQVALGMDRVEFCQRFGWSFEKYRKVAQRARARLRRLTENDLGGEVNPNPRARVPLSRGSRNREIGTHL